MIYLASPYSHPDVAVRERRYQAACRAVVEFLRAGQPVFSPIVHTHGLVDLGLPTDWSFWEPFDRAHLARCDEVVVLTLDGWQDSVGVAAEIAFAQSLGIPVRHHVPSDNRPATLAPVPAETVR